MNSITLKNIGISIKTLPKNIWSKKKEKKVWIPATIIGLYLVSTLFGGGATTDVFTYKVEPKEFVQNVSLTGKVIAAKNVDMGFEASARVQKVNVQVGDIVKKGTILASLENGDFASAVQKNYAIVQSEQAKLDNLRADAKQEDKKLAEDNVANATAILELSKQTLLDQIRDTYTKADDAIRFNIDPSFRDPRSQNPEFIHLIDQNTALRESLKADRVTVGTILARVNDSFAIESLSVYRSEISQIQRFINDANTAISTVSEKAIAGGDATYIAQIATQKTAIALARTSFSSSVSLLNQAELSYKNNVNALSRAKNELQILNSGATYAELAIQRANIQSAQAGVGSASAQLAKTVIRAPFDGIITKVDIKEGEISSPNTPVISMLNDGEYQIETFVSENDISKLKVGQSAKISLDAYGRNTFFEALVISVDPAETVKDGVSTYRTKIQFVGKDEKVKSGMTANIDIETNRRADIIQVPQVAIVLESGVKKIRILDDTSCVQTTTETSPVLSPTCSVVLNKAKSISLIPIETGEIGSNGDIEVVSGIVAGQTIIYSTKAK
jgi:multidrug efflux pump subunit AcrA (membrane-fusion protein)